MLTFTTPLLLYGLGLAVLPVVAHLLQRHARRTLVFPTIALLVESMAQQSRFHRLKRWLLLLLRLLAVACIVLAFTRPLWLSAHQGEDADATAATALVVIVDGSASMAQSEHGVSLLERMKSAGQQALDGLAPGTDVANIIFAEASPRLTFPRLSMNLPGLRNELTRYSPTAARADPAAAVAAAGKQLARHRGPARLLFITDRQRTNWQEAIRSRSLREMLPRETKILFADAGETPPENVALSRPRHFPGRPLAGQPLDLAVHVTNFSDRMKEVRLTLQVEEVATEVQSIRLEAGDQQEATFTLPAAPPGRIVASFGIQEDGLAIDNQADLVVEPAARLPVILLSDEDSEEAGTGAYYLSRALAPRGNDVDSFLVRTLRPAELVPGSIEEGTVVFVGYLGTLSAAAADVLVAALRSGGGMVFFCGDGPVPENLQALERSAEGKLLPWTVETRRRPAAYQEPLRITSGRWQSRWFREFDEQSQLAFGDIQFHEVWRTGAQNAATETLLLFSDGSPALGSRAVGRGQFLLANFSADGTASDLGRHGAFVALMQMLAKSVQPEEGGEAFRLVGQPYVHPVLFEESAAGASFSALGPQAEPAPIFLTRQPGGVSVTLPQTPTPGIYRIHRGESVIGAAAINVDPRESDLRRLDEAELRAAFETGVASVAGGEAVVPGDETFSGRGRPLWGNLLAAALGFIGAELLLLGWWRR